MAPILGRNSDATPRATAGSLPSSSPACAKARITSPVTALEAAFETFGAPGITYELGAATPHERIARIVPGAAEEAMRLLLAEPAPGAAPGAAKAEPSAVGSR